jgi:hypothetical protein
MSGYHDDDDEDVDNVDLDEEIEDELDEIMTAIEEARNNLEPRAFKHLLKRVKQECNGQLEDE